MIHREKYIQAYSIKMSMLIVTGLCTLVSVAVQVGDIAQQRQKVVAAYRAYQNAGAPEKEAKRAEVVKWYKHLIDSMPQRKGKEAIEQFLNANGISPDAIATLVEEEAAAPIRKAIAEEHAKGRDRELALQNRVNVLAIKLQQLEENTDAEAAFVKSEHARLQAKLGDYQEALTQKQEELVRAVSKDASPAEIEKLRKDLVTAQQAHAKQLEEAEQKYKKQEEAFTASQIQRMQLQQQLATAQQKAQELEALKKKFQEVEENLQEGSAEQKEFGQLKAKLEEEFRSEKASLLEQLSKLQASESELKAAAVAAAQAHQKNLAKLQSQLEDLQGRLQAHALAHQKALKDAEINLTTLTVPLQERINRLQKQTGHDANKNRELSAQITSLVENLNALTAERDQLRLAASKAQVESLARQAPLEELRKKVAFLVDTRAKWPAPQGPGMLWGQGNAAILKTLSEKLTEALDDLFSGTKDARKTIEYLNYLQQHVGNPTALKVAWPKHWESFLKRIEEDRQQLEQKSKKDLENAELKVQQDQKNQQEEQNRSEQERKASQQPQSQAQEPEISQEPKTKSQKAQQEEAGEEIQQSEAELQPSKAARARAKLEDNNPDLKNALAAFYQSASSKTLDAVIKAVQGKGALLSNEEREAFIQAVYAKLGRDDLSKRQELATALSAQGTTEPQPVPEEEEKKKSAEAEQGSGVQAPEVTKSAREALINKMRGLKEDVSADERNRIMTLINGAIQKLSSQNDAVVQAIQQYLNNLTPTGLSDLTNVVKANPLAHYAYAVTQRHALAEALYKMLSKDMRDTFDVRKEGFRDLILAFEKEKEPSVAGDDAAKLLDVLLRELAGKTATYTRISSAINALKQQQPLDEQQRRELGLAVSEMVNTKQFTIPQKEIINIRKLIESRDTGAPQVNKSGKKTSFWGAAFKGKVIPKSKPEEEKQKIASVEEKRLADLEETVRQAELKAAKERQDAQELANAEAKRQEEQRRADEAEDKRQKDQEEERKKTLSLAQQEADRQGAARDAFKAKGPGLEAIVAVLNVEQIGRLLPNPDQLTGDAVQDAAVFKSFLTKNDRALADLISAITEKVSEDRSQDVSDYLTPIVKKAAPEAEKDTLTRALLAAL